jgi:hypothetical protein
VLSSSSNSSSDEDLYLRCCSGAFVVCRGVPEFVCEIMGKHGSDKGNIDITTSCHNYTVIYYNLFKDIQNKQLRIFELGLGTNNTDVPSNMGEQGFPGASLYGWSEFFTNSKVYGADIDQRILFNTENIKTYYCDQTNPHVIKYMWNEPELTEPFDIIIEDGLHEFAANVCFFENSIHKLKQNGFYIIEDIMNNEIDPFSDKINEWKTKYPDLYFHLLKIPSLVNQWDNNMLIVKKQ